MGEYKGQNRKRRAKSKILIILGTLIKLKKERKNIVYPALYGNEYIKVVVVLEALKLLLLLKPRSV